MNKEEKKYVIQILDYKEPSYVKNIDYAHNNIIITENINEAMKYEYWQASLEEDYIKPEFSMAIINMEDMAV